ITNLTSPGKTVTFENNAATPLRPIDVIALLSTPKKNGSETNRVLARIKAITGPAAEKGPLTNEFSFRYQLQVEITPHWLPMLEANLHDARITLRWPVVERGNGWFVGNNRKSFRASMAGAFKRETN